MKRILLLLILLNFSLLQAQIVPLNDTNYEKHLSENNKTVIMFSATWCGACKEMKPLYKEFAESYKGEVTFASIDTDESEKASFAYKVESIPTTIFFENGKEVERSVGSMDKEELLLMVDKEQSIALLTEKCLAGDGSVCMDVADIYEEDKIVKQDYVKVFEYTQKSCEFNNMTGCNNLGYIYGNGEGVDVDLEKSIKYYTLACDNDYGLGCLNLGGLFNEGWYGATVDHKKAFGYFEKASTLESDGEAYYELAKMYQEGLGTLKDETKAQELFKKACSDGYDKACPDDEEETNESDEKVNENETETFADIMNESKSDTESTKFLLIMLAIYVTLGILVVIFTLIKRRGAKK